MAVPFGFSVGDVLAVGKVLKEATFALKKSGGAADSYQDVIQQLQVWSTVLEEISQLTPALDDVPDVNAIKGQAQALQAVLEAFLAKISRFEDFLGSCPKASRGRAAFSKIDWATRIVKEVDTFRETMVLRASCLSMLIQAISQKQQHKKQIQIEALGQKITALQSYLSSNLVVKFEQEIATNTSLITSQIIASEARLFKNIQSLFGEQETKGATVSTDAPVQPENADGERSLPFPWPKTMLNNNFSSPGLITAWAHFLDYAIEIFRTICRSMIQLVIWLWPELLVFLRQIVALPKRIIARNTSDCICFEDVLGYIHYLPVQYYRKWDVFATTFEACLADLPNSQKLMQRIKAGKFRILDHSIGLVTKNDWPLVVRRGARMSMSVEMDKLTAEEQLSSDLRCLQEKCRGRLILGNHDAYQCEACSRSYVRGRNIPSTDSRRHSSRQHVRSPTEGTGLKDVLCRSDYVLIEKYINAESPFTPMHETFQDLRRQASEDFIKHCERRIRQIEQVKVKLQSLQETIRQILDSKLEPQPYSSYDLFQSRITTGMTSVDERALARNRGWGRGYLRQIPGTPTLNADLVLWHRDMAHYKKIERLRVQELELKEARAYKRLYLPPDPEASEKDFLDAVASNDATRINAALTGQVDVSSSRKGSTLQTMIIGKQGNLVDLLLELGMNPLAKRLNEESALETAVIGGDASVILSMLVAVNCFWTSYIKDKSSEVKTIAEVITTGLKSAVKRGNHILVELFLYFGADPFFTEHKGRDQDTESAFEVATRCGMEDMIASFITAAIEEHDTMSVPSAYNIVKSVNTAAHTAQIKLPSGLGSTCKFVRASPHLKIRSTRTILQWLQTGHGNFGSVFVGLPLTRSAVLAQGQFGLTAGVKCGLIEPLKRTRSYFQHRMVENSAALDRIIGFVDRALESVDELLEATGSDINVIDALMRTCLKEGARDNVFNYIESIWRLLVSADSEFPLVTIPQLDQTSYWRLQPNGFILIMKLLTDLKRDMRQLKSELAPLWRKLRKAKKGLGRTSVVITHTARSSMLLPPQAAYSLSVSILPISRSQAVLSNAIDVSIVYEERIAAPTNIQDASDRFERLNELRTMLERPKSNLCESSEYLDFLDLLDSQGISFSSALDSHYNDFRANALDHYGTIFRIE